MKKALFRALALALAFTLLCAAALAEVRTTGDVWMRKGPGKNYETIVSVAQGKSLEYLGESSVDERGVTWYKVSDGKHEGWVSSRYSQLVGESTGKAQTAAPTQKPTAQPTRMPTPEPTPEPTAAPTPTEAPVSLPGLSIGKDGTVQEDAAPAPGSGQAVELSVYYLNNLVEAANGIGLISYRQVESEAPFQYYDDAVILAGNQLVENIVIYGPGYEVYGVSVGMSGSAARACLNAAGLDYVASMNGFTYEHRATPASLFTDGNGHDSCINVWVDESDTVTEIDWSTYTG